MDSLILLKFGTNIDYDIWCSTSR